MNLVLAFALLQAVEMNMSLPPQPVLPALGGRDPGASSDMPHMTAHGPRAHYFSLRGSAFGMQAVLYFPLHPYALEYSVRLGHQELRITAHKAIGQERCKASTSAGSRLYWGMFCLLWQATRCMSALQQHQPVACWRER